MFSLFRENLYIALDSIKSQILRTILTVIIIAIGIWALVGILSAVAALENTISSDFASMSKDGKSFAATSESCAELAHEYFRGDRRVRLTLAIASCISK